eukprot:CAMPEP_0178707348 /NCGR_PEP_ID=MMETSP0699-20121125/15976_1 /TAXON_ID=265572 /ORGANISM="Extubocellulus spinifer, Strain CCMP396" /LENGTH=42 /DNA_ID= /DNA_START= /DNA_END= /DNA_ORIENTATION=
MGEQQQLQEEEEAASHDDGALGRLGQDRSVVLSTRARNDEEA